MQTTIFALSSATGRAGVAVIRVSGPHARDVLSGLAGAVPVARRAVLRPLRQPSSGLVLDRALVLWFPAPHSFTGEDVVEFHVHGGRAVIEAVLEAIGEFPGSRMAEAGEFARRAFENGQLDLTSVEGLADLIDAETEAQRKQALRQSSGALARRYEQWRETLIMAIAETEADLDFSDEADVSGFTAHAARSRVAELETEIRTHLDDGRRGEMLRDGFRVAILGPVNAGKSSLLNALARRDAAIVSAKPGTTRDIVEVRLDLNGYPVLVSDTAGMRDTPEEIEAEGIRRAMSRATEADYVIWLVDGGADVASRPPPALAQTARLCVVVNKSDLLTDRERYGSDADLFISAHTGESVSDLVSLIASEASRVLATGDKAPITRERHRRELTAAADALQRFLGGSQDDVELRCEDLRQAATCLGRIIGRVDVEEILDRIFAQFCIGK